MFSTKNLSSTVIVSVTFLCDYIFTEMRNHGSVPGSNFTVTQTTLMHAHSWSSVRVSAQQAHHR